MTRWEQHRRLEKADRTSKKALPLLRVRGGGEGVLLVGVGMWVNLEM